MGQPWARVPTEFVPTSLPVNGLLGITDDGLALIIGQVEVFPTGLTFALLATPRPGRGLSDPSPYGQMSGYGPAHLAERLQIGLLHADGRMANNTWIHGAQTDRAPAAALIIVGGSGNDVEASSRHWAWPIPAHGDLTLLFRWPARGLSECRLALPGDELRAAAATSAAAAIWPGATLPPPSPNL